MAIEAHDVKIFVDPDYRPYRACFKIGVQTFYVCEREDRKEAEWYVDVLKTAFANYAFFLGGAAGIALKERDKEIERLREEVEILRATLRMDDESYNN